MKTQIKTNEDFIIYQIIKKVSKTLVYDDTLQAYRDNGDFIISMNKNDYDVLIKYLNKCKLV